MNTSTDTCQHGGDPRAGKVPDIIRHARYSLDDRPFIVIWETTRACDLACRHCRAEACKDRNPDELNTEEGFRLIDEIASFGSPHPLVVLTGGDPFKREDLYDLVRHGAEHGLPMSVSPSATPLLTEEALRKLKEAGAVAISLSVDGSTAALHDGFRRVDGVLDRTLQAWRQARGIGLKLQINTTVTPHNLDDLPEIFRIVREIGAMSWSLFFLVPTGRGRQLEELNAREYEDVLNFCYDVDKIVPLKTTEAPHFRRVAIERQVLERKGISAAEVMGLGTTYRKLRARLERMVPEFDFDAPQRVRRAPLDVNAGRGFVFISNVGNVYPSGFLPTRAGNVRRNPLPELYRQAPLFRMLRDPNQLKDRCGRCEFRTVCGGSRSRAYGVTGDLLAEEPRCAYEPNSFPFPEEVEAMISGRATTTARETATVG